MRKTCFSWLLSGSHPGEVWGVVTPLLRKQRILLMDDIIRQLSNNNFTPVQINNINLILKKSYVSLLWSSKIGHFCLLSLSEPPSLKIPGCTPDYYDVKTASWSAFHWFPITNNLSFCKLIQKDGDKVFNFSLSCKGESISFMLLH